MDIKSRLLKAKAQQLLIAHDKNKRWQEQALEYVEKVRREKALAVSIPPNVPNINQNPHLLNILSFQQQMQNKTESLKERKQHASLSCSNELVKSKKVAPQLQINKVPQSQKASWMFIKQNDVVPQNSELFDVVKSITNSALKTFLPDLGSLVVKR